MRNEQTRRACHSMDQSGSEEDGRKGKVQMNYVPNEKRYDGAMFRRCGQSGIALPPVSVGLWQNFGGTDVFEMGVQ